MYKRIVVLIIWLYLILAAASTATPPTPMRRSRVDRPTHYMLLASRHSILEEYFAGWNRKSVSVADNAYNDVVVIKFGFKIPREMMTLELDYSFEFELKFIGDSLINDSLLRALANPLQEVLSHIENHSTVKLFCESTEVTSALIYWSGAESAIKLISPAGDTLIYSTMWPPGPKRERVRRLSFTEQKLLDQLELYLFRFPLPQVTEFRKRVGIGYARLYKNVLFVSSGQDCDNATACFFASHSGKQAFSYKLPAKYDWTTFSNWLETINAMKTYLEYRSDSSCTVEHALYSAVLVMGYMKETGARGVYVMYRCDDEKARALFVETSPTNRSPFKAVAQDPSILDSISVDWWWD